jgi:AcrR family transcriptional regulator
LAESAFKLFSKHGINSVSLDEVATHAKVTKGSLYWHFKSKDEVIHAACSHYYRDYFRRINSALAHITNPAKRLEETLRVSVRICLLDRENRVFTTEVFTLANHDEDLRRSWRQFSETVREFYISLVKAAVATGQVKTGSPEHAVDFMLSAMEGLKLRALYEPHICSAESEKTILETLKHSVGFSA